MPHDGDQVIMSGRSSGVVRGQVSLLGTTRVFLDRSPIGYYLDVFEVRPVAGDSHVGEEGDSGSAWMLCDSQGRATSTLVGLNTAVGLGGGSAFGCFATQVFDALQIDPAGIEDLVDHTHDHATLPPDAGSLPVGGPSATIHGGVPHRITAAVLKLYRVPIDESENVIGQRYFGDTVFVTGRKGEWLKVDVTGSGSTDGWMDANHLEPIEPGASPKAAIPAPVSPAQPPAISAPGIASVEGLGAVDAISALTPTLVKAICSNSPMSGITASLPSIIAGLQEFELTDKSMVAMALGTVAAEVGVWFRPVDEWVYSGNTSVTPYDRYDGRANLVD